MINNSFGAILLISVLSVIIIVVFSLMKANLPIFNKTIKQNKNLIKNLYLSEIILGIIIISIFAGYLFYRSTIVFAIFLLLLIIIVFFVGIFFFKDYIAGLIIKASANYEINDTLIFEKYEGKIIQFSKRFLIIINDKGDKIFIPYSKIISEIKHIKGATDTIDTDSFIIKCKHDNNSTTIVKDISNNILALPWVNHTILPDVVIENINNEIIELKITVYALDSKYLKKIEMSVREVFES